jgi:phosphatidylinositol phospholipase C delta
MTLCRAVTPNSSRMDSSNYDPMVGWALGQQFVCMNQQTSDVYMRMYRGFFRENGGVGYVPKPAYQLGQGSRPGRVKLTLNILGAHQLPKPSNSSQGEVIDPFVVVSIHGAAGDSARYQTKTVLDNGFNPEWNEVGFPPVGS